MKNIIQTSEDVRKLGTILGVWAHPDDEVFSMGGLMATAVQNGQKVACVTATYGEAGVQDETRWPANQLAEIRKQELQNAYKILGVSHHQWLGYPDGGCDGVGQSEAVHRLTALINQYRPDSIMTFGPDGITGHSDHTTVSAWATRANSQAANRATIYHVIQTTEQYEAMQEVDKELNVYFNIDKPCTCESGQCDIQYELDDSVYNLKLAALRAMPSQTEAMMAKFHLQLRPCFGHETFERL
jgi:LmbE family N-acetylglucosaminyl deacetylase